MFPEERRLDHVFYHVRGDRVLKEKSVYHSGNPMTDRPTIAKSLLGLVSVHCNGHNNLPRLAEQDISAAHS